MAHVNFAQRFAVHVEDQKIGTHAVGVRYDLPAGIPHGRMGHARENGSRRQGRRVHRQDTHAQTPGQTCNQLVVDHGQLARRLDLKLADVGFALSPSESVRTRRTQFRCVGNEHKSPVGAEDGPFRVVETGDHLLDDCRNRVYARMHLPIRYSARQRGRTNGEKRHSEIG